MVCCLLAGCSPQAPAESESVGEFQRVDLDRFIEQEKEAFAEYKNRKLIRMAVPVWFTARMKRLPEKKDMAYIYTALQMAEVSPLPEVKHRMFIESDGGQIISVYVEKQAAEKIKQLLDEEQSAGFFGYHAYTYKNGPALLIVDVVAD